MVFYLRKNDQAERTIRKKKWMNDGSAGLLMSDCQATNTTKDSSIVCLFVFATTFRRMLPQPFFKSKAWDPRQNVVAAWRAMMLVFVRMSVFASLEQLSRLKAWEP